MRGPAPTHPTAPGVIRVSYPGYSPSGLTQPKFMKFISTPGFSKKWCLMKTCLKYVFGNVIFILVWIMSHSWVSFCLCNM